MTRREVADRHASSASSGADSWTSTETVKNIFAPHRRGTPVRILTDKEQRYVLLAPDLDCYTRSLCQPLPPDLSSTAVWFDACLHFPRRLFAAASSMFTGSFMTTKWRNQAF